jgi:tetratricopeptide (TPR) repeat protein
MCYRLKGRILESTNSFEEALKEYDISLRMNPSCAHRHLDRADVLRKLGYYQESLSAYDNALEINNTLYEAYNNKAICLKQLG